MTYNYYTPGYTSWRAMLARCFNPSDPSYHRYGGRGITVCDRWKNSFIHFIEDMGIRPDGLSIERRETNGNYEPSNCYWATKIEQLRNRRFWTTTARNIDTPYITQRPSGSYKVSLNITRNNFHCKTLKTYEEAEAHRDICLFERDFLRQRGLTYD